jgi:hypothetical protein
MAFHGRQRSGARRRLREIKREEAAERSAVPTPVERTKAYRLGPTLPRDEAHGGPYRTPRSVTAYREGFKVENGHYPGEA